MSARANPDPPRTVRMHERDNVAIVVNETGLPAGTLLPGGLALRDQVPQGHKVALVDIAAELPVVRYGVPIGYAVQNIPAGSWVHERLLKMPAARRIRVVSFVFIRTPFETRIRPANRFPGDVRMKGR